MTHLTRRSFLTTGAALAALPAAPALALSGQEAAALVGRMVEEINAVIASGKSESGMFREFERIFVKYGDTKVIAATALGVDGRRATNAQKKAFTEAFTGYISRKYGKRFREFIGGRLDVQRVKTIRRGYEVQCTAFLRGTDPFEVSFHVSDSKRFYNMFIEGVDMLLTERTEIGAMLDARRGNIDTLIADLRRAG
ncbi:MlaC/ttg2D family ABC transporter substrate-binding protein [Maliponia aquimaris]|uniref:Toluene tolerance, Ttg2 n=1 Tax=Maliponia aquimaris TaxID=1673631 RepID=A0A238KCS4_9RHOB|nr:ABC transporter substrate-binding protein [Maliponia aquimaris]SMX40633.1 Toluene tolerance, Ttg2 [Maliponia aquimaris]